MVKGETEDIRVYKERDRVSFPAPGIFGHCSSQNYLKFMHNEETNSCVAKEVEQINKEACNAVSFNNFGQIEILSGNGISIIKPTVGNVRKFSVKTFEEEVDLPSEYT